MHFPKFQIVAKKEAVHVQPDYQMSFAGSRFYGQRMIFNREPLEPREHPPSPKRLWRTRKSSQPFPSFGDFAVMNSVAYSRAGHQKPRITLHFPIDRAERHAIHLGSIGCDDLSDTFNSILRLGRRVSLQFPVLTIIMAGLWHSCKELICSLLRL
jgi:hypothetical protein